MSVFVIHETTINEIVTFLFHTSGTTTSTVKAHLQDHLQISSPVQVGEAMQHLNWDAMDGRYGPGNSAEEWCAYQYVPHSVSKIQVYKSLRCWLHQCAEDKIPLTPLYLIMEDFAATLAQNIVTELPEYHRAHWD